MQVLENLSEDDERKAIVTVTSTKGSTPEGWAKMIVWSEGRTLGSIGGGCSEGNNWHQET